MPFVVSGSHGRSYMHLSALTILVLQYIFVYRYTQVFHFKKTLPQTANWRLSVGDSKKGVDTVHTLSPYLAEIRVDYHIRSQTCTQQCAHKHCNCRGDRHLTSASLTDSRSSVPVIPRCTSHSRVHETRLQHLTPIDNRDVSTNLHRYTSPPHPACRSKNIPM